MIFQDTLASRPPHEMEFFVDLFGCVFLILFIVGFFTLGLKKLPRKNKLLVLLVTVLSYMAAFFSFTFTVYGLPGEQKNWEDRQKQVLTSNIMQKYDVDSVKLDGKGYEEYGHLMPGVTDEQDVVVEVDGSEYVFTLTQDEGTFEPTLKNPPVAGGTIPEGISATDLLKNKKE